MCWSRNITQLQGLRGSVYFVVAVLNRSAIAHPKAGYRDQEFNFFQKLKSSNCVLI